MPYAAAMKTYGREVGMDGAIPPAIGWPASRHDYDDSLRLLLSPTDHR